MAYRHGTYGEVGDSITGSTRQSSTNVIYIGKAPINLVKGYKDKNLVNSFIELIDKPDAHSKIGYSDNWDNFTLSEVVSAHFDNRKGNIGPIYVVNVLDPAIHKKAEKTTKQIAFTNGRAEFASDTIILDSIALAEKVLDTDYTVDYNFTKGTVILQSLQEEPITGSVTCSYDEVDTVLIAENDIIGTVTANGEYSGIALLELFNRETNKIPNLLAIPGYMDNPKVYSAAVTAANAVDEQWQCFVCCDLPIVAGDEKIDTIEKVLDWKEKNNYKSERAKSCWPMAKDSQTGRIYHGSVLMVTEFMRQDAENEGIPKDTCSNKEVPVTEPYFGKDSKTKGYGRKNANKLNEKGITTFLRNNGKWVLWGGHTDAFEYGTEMDARVIFDTYVRMLYHIVNDFQVKYADDIDKGLSLQRKDSIINEEQEFLDYLVAIEALVGLPKVLFLAKENTTTDIMNGDFDFDIPVTVTPQGKSYKAKVYYTDDGLKSYVGEEAA